MKVLRSKIFIQPQGPLSGVWRRGRGGVKAVYKLDVQTQPDPLGSEIRGYRLGICRRSDALGSGTRLMPTPAGWNLSRNRRIPGLQPYIGLEAAMTSPNCRLRPPQSPRLAAALCWGLKGLILMPASQRLNLPAPSLQLCLAPLPTPPAAERRRWMRHPHGDLWTPRTAAAAAHGGAAEHPGKYPCPHPKGDSGRGVA